jgi:hypothetical protein
MTGFYRYAVVFKTTILNNTNDTIIIDPVRIEFFEGERVYKIPYQQARILPVSENSKISKDVSIKLESGKYIEFIARTKENIPHLAQEICEHEIEKVISMISLVYTSDIFDTLIFKGWLLEEKGIMPAWIKFANKLSINGTEFDKQLTSITKIKLSNREINERFTLISKFYTRALLYEPGEEKFLFLWTILEIFPMKNTSNIKPISEYLSKITKISSSEVQTRLGIGRTFGTRSDLVHNGKFEIDIKDKGDFFAKIEDIVRVVLRELVGLPYNHELDKYLYEL